MLHSIKIFIKLYFSPLWRGFFKFHIQYLFYIQVTIFFLCFGAWMSNHIFQPLPWCSTSESVMLWMRLKTYLRQNLPKSRTTFPCTLYWARRIAAWNMKIYPNFLRATNLIVIIHFPALNLEEMNSIPQKYFPISILVNEDKKALDYFHCLVKTFHLLLLISWLKHVLMWHYI